MGKTNYVHNASDFPSEPHLAIIEFSSITIPGDERSRQCPGHGYPEHTETTMNYMWYKVEDRDEWLKQIERNMGIGLYATKRSFVALDQGKKVTPQMRVEVSI